MEKIAIYPGSFDPITNGHVDVIERAAKLFDRLIVAVGKNSKKQYLFDESERLEMAKESISHIPNASAEIFTGLTVEEAKRTGSAAIVRGIRAVTDYEFEFQIAHMNRKMEPEIATIFLMPHEKYSYLSSSIIREIASYGRDASEFVPEFVRRKLIEKFSSE